MAENPVEKAIREADAACQAAIMATPLLYQSFIIFLSESKRVGGTRQQPIYATIRIPYMSANGRIKMAGDDHREAGATLNMTTQFETSHSKVMCKCTAMSSLYGTRTGWGEVELEPDSNGRIPKNAYEKAETSAISRALRFMGYGLFGGDVTSAEEIMSRDYETALPTPSIIPSSTHSSERPEAIEPASEKQLGFLYSLLKNYGIEDGHKRGFIEFIYPCGMGKRECSDAIEALKDRGEMPDGWQTYYFNFLVKRQGMERQRIVDKMMAICRHSEPEKLTTSDFVLVVQALKTNAAEAPAPVLDDEDDLPLLPPTPTQNFNAWLGAISKDCNVERGVVEAWVMEKFGKIDSAQKQDEVYEKVRAMDLGVIKSEIKVAV